MGRIRQLILRKEKPPERAAFIVEVGNAEEWRKEGRKVNEVLKKLGKDKQTGRE